MRVTVSRDPFDTELLQRKCGRVLLSEVDDLVNLDELSRALRGLTDAELIYLSTPYQPRLVAEVHRLGFFQVTTRNVYARGLESGVAAPGIRLPTLHKAELRARHDIEDFGHLLRSLVTRSRYWKDERIPRGNALALYQRWFYNSIYADYAEEVVAALDGGEIVGLVTLKEQGTNLYLDLIVVDERAQGKGVGRLLIHEAFAYGAARRALNVKVETEGENVPANRFYQKLGFLLDTHTLAFHQHAPVLP